MGLWSKIKKFINGVVDGILNTLLLKPLRAVLSAMGFFKFVQWIEKIVKFILDILNFFLDMIGILFDLFEFGVKFIEILIEIALNMGYYSTRPFEFITLLLNLGFTLATFVIAFIYHKFTFPKNMKIAEFFIYAVLSIPITLAFVAIIAVWVVWKLFVEYALLYNIDKASKGYISSFLYRYFIACENPPDDWYMLGGAHNGNTSAKNVFAYNPCPNGSNFRGNKYSLFCEHNDKYELAICPEANLYRAYVNLKPIGKLSNGRLIQDRQFMKMNALKKKIFIENYEQTVQQNINRCSEYNDGKKNLLKSICIKQNSESVNTNPLINKLCHDLYCSKTHEAFCHKLRSPGQFADTSGVTDKDRLTLIVNILIAVTFITLIVGRKHFLANSGGA